MDTRNSSIVCIHRHMYISSVTTVHRACLLFYFFAMIIALFMWNMQGIFHSFNNMDKYCGQYRAWGEKKPAGNPVSLFISVDDAGM